MYQFYYGYLKTKYQDQCSLLFTDTDSLCCKIQTQDLYRDMGENLNLFDTSNFEVDHPQYSASNCRVLGKFKSKTGSIAPKEFVGLRAKMYSLHVPSCPSKSQKKAKGIQKPRNRYATANFWRFCVMPSRRRRGNFVYSDPRIMS